MGVYKIMHVDTLYKDLINNIIVDGSEVQTRNSITKRKFTMTVKFTSTPLISVRRTAWKNALREMEWFLSGSNNINDLHPKVRHWWKPWADVNGFLPNNYSRQFRDFYGISNSVDQIDYLVNTLKKHPFSRRSVITTWNTADMLDDNTPITNCHGSLIQLFVEPDDTVHMTMYQRSSDMLLGLPHNWIQYWALLMYLAERSNRKVGSFIWIGGDCHIYKDHYDIANKIIKYASTITKTPQLLYRPTSKEFKADDFILDAKYEPRIKESLKMAI